jgi:hypothetical protein
MDQDHGGLVGRRGALCSLICSAVCARSVLSALSGRGPARWTRERYGFVRLDI